MLLALDILLLSFAFSLAYKIRFRLAWQIFQEDALSSNIYYEYLTLFLVVLWIFIYGVINGLYNRKNLLGGIDEYSLLFRSSIIGLMALIFVSFLQPTFIIAR